VFFGPVSAFAEFKKHIQDNCRFFFHSYADGENAFRKDIFEGVSLISPGYLFTVNGKEYRDEFLRTYGSPPGDASAFAYDMTDAVIRSVTVSTDDVDSLKNYLRKTDFEGVTGRISFDERGNRLWKPELMTVRKGEFVRER
ncbi:MAG TPA: hypothetical protein VK155_18560, partial [Bacteroidales bacterium]|nr:hypothetical protein [Bacteroidales bacterium]